MARLVVTLSLLIALAPSVAAVQLGDVILPVTDALSSCVHFEDESEEGPAKVGQEEPGVFVGVPATGQTDGEGVGSGGSYTGAGVFYRNRDCELPALGDFQGLAQPTS